MPKKKPDSLIGMKLVEMRPMTDKEMETEGWECSRWDDKPVALVFDNGVVVYPSRDDEGNGPGRLFGVGKDGMQFILIPREETHA